MIFCGHCGLQLPPGATQCPRCGTPVEGDVAVEEFYADDPTMASFPYVPHTPRQPQAYGQRPSRNPQQVVPGADQQGRVDPDAPTSWIDAPRYPTSLPRSPSTPNPAPPYVDYSRGNNYPTHSTVYPGTVPGSMGYPPSSSSYPSAYSSASSQRAKGRLASLVIILLGLLLILGAMVLFVLKQHGIIGSAATTPTNQAKALIQQYYDDINKKDFQSAYNLWKDDPQRQSLADFSQGYAHTQHDDLTVDNGTALSDGTIKVFVTINATEDVPSGGTQNSVYKGYYIIGPQNGALKILSGQLDKVS